MTNEGKMQLTCCYGCISKFTAFNNDWNNFHHATEEGQTYCIISSAIVCPWLDFVFPS